MEILTSIIVDAIWIAFWFWVGSKLVEKVKSKSLQSNATAISKQDLMVGQIKKIPMLKTEIHNDVIFAFDINEDSFIAQGSTIDEVAESAYKYRKIDLAYVLHNEQSLWFMNGKVTTTNVQIL